MTDAEREARKIVLSISSCSDGAEMAWDLWVDKKSAIVLEALQRAEQRGRLETIKFIKELGYRGFMTNAEQLAKEIESKFSNGYLTSKEARKDIIKIIKQAENRNLIRWVKIIKELGWGKLQNMKGEDACKFIVEALEKEAK